MKIQYEIKGVALDVADLIKIHTYYEAACTAEYLMENYGIEDEKDAMYLGYEVRMLMDKYDCYESEAINAVLGREGYYDTSDGDEEEQ